MKSIEFDDSTCPIALETIKHKNDRVNRILILQLLIS